MWDGRSSSCPCPDHCALVSLCGHRFLDGGIDTRGQSNSRRTLRSRNPGFFAFAGGKRGLRTVPGSIDVRGGSCQFSLPAPACPEAWRYLASPRTNSTNLMAQGSSKVCPAWAAALPFSLRSRVTCAGEIAREARNDTSSTLRRQSATQAIHEITGRDCSRAPPAFGVLVGLSLVY